MSFRGTRNKINFDHLIQNEHLLRVEQVDDLGFNLSLSSKCHIELVTCKAFRTFSLILRNAFEFDEASCIKMLHTSPARSILEYGSVICVSL